MMDKNNSRIDAITAHFESEATVFDSLIIRLIPHYKQMIEALVSIIPEQKDRSLSIIDLGCGTGTVAHTIQERFPDVEITCVDLAQNMLDMAAQKIVQQHTFIKCDFDNLVFPTTYDVIVSSLALQHLDNDSDKISFYRKLFNARRPGGLFIDIDVVLASDPHVQNVYIDKWIEFMSKTTSQEEINERFLKVYYTEDRPASIMTHTDLLQQTGFSCIDIILRDPLIFYFLNNTESPRI